MKYKTLLSHLTLLFFGFSSLGIACAYAESDPELDPAEAFQSAYRLMIAGKGSPAGLQRASAVASPTMVKQTKENQKLLDDSRAEREKSLAKSGIRTWKEGARNPAGSKGFAGAVIDSVKQLDPPQVENEVKIDPNGIPREIDFRMKNAAEKTAPLAEPSVLQGGSAQEITF